jgi:hypothetical protein
LASCNICGIVLWSSHPDRLVIIIITINELLQWQHQSALALSKHQKPLTHVVSNLTTSHIDDLIMQFHAVLGVFLGIKPIQRLPYVAEIKHCLAFAEHLKNDITFEVELEVCEAFKVVYEEADVFRSILV